MNENGIRLSAVYRKSANIVARKIAGEMILVPIRQDIGDMASIFSMNEVGSSIWDLLNGEKTVEQVRDSIINEYDVAPDQLENDICEFLVELESVGAVSMVEED